jgi:uncharacterized protein YecE (DUF72 family)
MLAEAHVGTSGFAFREWVGRVYPRGAAASQLLPSYAQRLSAVEVVTTYTRLPNLEQMLSWAQSVPPGFEFCFKAPNRISHELGDRGARSLGAFFALIEPLSDHLGPILLQVPESVQADRHALSAFLVHAPEGLPLAFDFHHPTWHDEATLRLLSAHECALVLTDRGEGFPRLEVTAGFAYVRIRRGDDRGEAVDDAIADWSERLAILTRRGIGVHAFLQHDRRGGAVERAMRLSSLLRAESDPTAESLSS